MGVRANKKALDGKKPKVSSDLSGLFTEMVVVSTNFLQEDLLRWKVSFNELMQRVDYPAFLEECGSDLLEVRSF